MESHYKKLIVWQKSIVLVKNIYKLTQKFPKEEIYGLVSQIRRCAVSIPSNIAEGNTRLTDKETVQFLYYAKSSAAELETQIIIAKEINFIVDSDYLKIENQITEILKMLSGLIKKKQDCINSYNSLNSNFLNSKL